MWICFESCSQPTWPLSVALVEESPRWFFISANTSCLSRPDEYLWWYCQECGARSLSKQMYDCKNFRNLPRWQVALPSGHLRRFLQPLWPLLNPLLKKHLMSGLKVETTCSSVFLLAFLFTYSSSSSGFAFSSRDISAYWASSPVTRRYQHCFQILSNCLWSLSHRQRSQISDQPLTFAFPLSSWCQLDIQAFAGIRIESWKKLDLFQPAAGHNLRDGDWGQVEDCVWGRESMRSGNLGGERESSTWNKLKIVAKLLYEHFVD